MRDITYAADGHLTLSGEAPQTGGEELLAQHLVDAAAILAAATPPDLSAGRQLLSEDFEHLRWFDLPASALATP